MIATAPRGRCAGPGRAIGQARAGLHTIVKTRRPDLELAGSAGHLMTGAVSGLRLLVGKSCRTSPGWSSLHREDPSPGLGTSRSGRSIRDRSRSRTVDDGWECRVHMRDANIV